MTDEEKDTLTAGVLPLVQQLRTELKGASFRKKQVVENGFEVTAVTYSERMCGNGMGAIVRTERNGTIYRRTFDFGFDCHPEKQNAVGNHDWQEEKPLIEVPGGQ